MKKISLLILIILATFTLSACGVKEEKVTENYRIVNYKRFEELVNKSDNTSYLIYVYAYSCGYCDSYKPKLQEVTEERDVIVYAIDMETLSEKERDKVRNYVGNYEGTPTTMIYKNGEQVAKEVGDMLKGDIATFISKHM